MVRATFRFRRCAALNRTFEVLKVIEGVTSGLTAGPLNRTFEVLKDGTTLLDTDTTDALNRTFEVLKDEPVPGGCSGHRL